jgi:hypothetical protein
MSILIWVMMESRGTVGLSMKYPDPHMPRSSPACQMKSSERFGLTLPFAKASAISSAETLPLPSSSAPLKIESGRAGYALRSSAISAFILVHSSGVIGSAVVLRPPSAPAGRPIML